MVSHKNSVFCNQASYAVSINNLPPEDIYHILSYLGPESTLNCLKAHRLFHVLNQNEKYIKRCMSRGIIESIKDDNITTEIIEYMYNELIKSQCIYIASYTSYNGIIANNFIKYIKWYYGYDTVINIYDEIYNLFINHDKYYETITTKNNLNYIMRKFGFQENTKISPKSLINLAFVISCKYGRFEIAKLLHDLSIKTGHMIDINICENMAFMWSCLNGHVEISNWLYLESIKNGKQININMPYNIVFNTPYFSDNILFVECCKRSNIDTCLWLLYVGIEYGFPIDIHMREEEPFIESCRYGNLAVAQLLYNIHRTGPRPININIRNDLPFIAACQNGHLNVVKWLYNLSTDLGSRINIKVQNDEAYKCSYMYGYEDLKEWVNQRYLEKGIDITQNEGYNRYLEMYNYGNTLYNYGCIIREYIRD